jgi:predicted DCC family thiol-disulfide oxidoreductase YuxK
MPAPEFPILFYDGVCGLCNGFVAFVARRDRAGRFRFAPLQGETAAQHLPTPASFSAASGPDSILLLDEEGLHDRSKAVLRVLAQLGGPWKLAAGLRLVPRFLRDAVYGFVAKNRYRWFGKTDACPLPEGSLRRRLLP